MTARAAAVDARTARHARSALHIAATRGDDAMCALLLRNGANFDALDALGATPLHACVAAGHVRSAKVLVDAGADADTRPLRGAARDSSARELAASVGGEMHEMMQRAKAARARDAARVVRARQAELRSEIWARASELREVFESTNQPGAPVAEVVPEVGTPVGG